MDVVEGTQPANPPSGTARIWVDVTDIAHVLNSTGTDATLVKAILENRIAFTWGTGWQAYTGYDGGYYKDSFGIVHLEGLATTNSISPGSTILTLPVGYRPVGNLLFLAMAYNGPGAGALVARVDIGVSGALLFSGGWIGTNWTPSATPNTSFLSFAGISFRSTGA